MVLGGSNLITWVPGIAAQARFGISLATHTQGMLLVQMDLELAERVACCWGAGPEATEEAVLAFASRYLDRFMEAAVGG